MVDSISPPPTLKKPNGKFHWDEQHLVLPSGSKLFPIATEQGQHPTMHDALVGGPSQSVAGDNKDHLTASASASVSPSSRAQSWTRPPARRPSLRRTKHIATRTFPPPIRPRSSKISLSAKQRPPKEHSDASLWIPLNASSEPRPMSRFVTSTHPARTLDTGPPRTYASRPGGGNSRTSKVRQPADEVRVTG
jgi:hypothetical protein